MNGVASHRHDARRAGAGFTLIEILVSVAVLALVLVLLMQVVGSVLNTYTGSRARAESTSTGRALLDAIARDIQGAYLRADLPAFPEDGSDRRLAFYTAQAGLTSDPAPVRDVSYVDYFLNDEPDEAELMRADVGMTWDEVDKLVFGSMAIPASTTRKLSDGVLAFNYRFILKNREITPNPPDLASITAVRVSLAVTDPQTLSVLRSTNTLGNLKTALEGATAADDLLSARAAWENWLRSSAAAGYDGRVLGGIAFFERVIPVHQQPGMEP